jgi:hypothetical protein
MNYTKPEVAVLGKAVRVIEQFVKSPLGTITDPKSPRLQKVNAAYDLDE